MTLTRDSSVPLYIQIKEHLRMQIQTGVYPAGTKVPSERQLARQFGVSRMTARQALQALAHEGLIYSQVGKGTYVSLPKIEGRLQALAGFSEEMAQRGVRTSSKVLIAVIEPADEITASYLQINRGDEVIVLSRVRMADEVPIALETAYLAHRLCPGLLNSHDFSRESLYEALRKDYGLVLVRAEQTIEARMAEPYECEALELEDPMPVLSITRVTYSDKGHPVEYVRSVYRGDKYRLHTTLMRDSESETRK